MSEALRTEVSEGTGSQRRNGETGTNGALARTERKPVRRRAGGARIVRSRSVAAFTLWYLPIHSPLLAGLAGVACFIVINIVGFLATGSVVGHHGEGSSRQGAKTL
jgi:hypothetical protein